MLRPFQIQEATHVPCEKTRTQQYNARTSPNMHLTSLEMAHSTRHQRSESVNVTVQANFSRD